MGMMTSVSCGVGPGRGPDKDREVYWRRPGQAIGSMSPKCLYYLEKLASRVPRQSRRSDAEALPAAAFALGFRILELEGLVQALFDEIDQVPSISGRLAESTTTLTPRASKTGIAGMDFVSVVHDIGKARAAGFLDPDRADQCRRPASPDATEPDQPPIPSTISPYPAILLKSPLEAGSYITRIAAPRTGPRAHF